MMKKIIVTSIIATSLMAGSASAGLIKNGALGMWASWDGQIADNDGYRSDGFVDPGWGGQDFDAEFLYYKLEGDILSLGLQAGFDLVDNHVSYGGEDYYGGNLAFSFNGDPVTTYAADFNLYTEDYYGHTVGNNTGSGVVGNVGPGYNDQGIYENVTWNNDVYFGTAAPFAMDTGDMTGAFIATSAGGASVGGEMSYYRTVDIDLSLLLGTDYQIEQISAHWTMSCGNNYVEGTVKVPPVSVPEPSSIALFSTGLFGLLAGVFVRRKKIQK